VTPVASPNLRSLIEAQISEAGIADRFRLIDGDSIEAMSAADVVMLASGTAALESALLGKPTVAAYAIGRLSGVIARLIGLNNKYFTIPNLIVDEPLIPEFIQEDMKAESLAQAVWELLEDPARREAISRRFATLREELALGADERAADAVIELAQ
jgi:lipid-A-disaccharide synthase